ncbi:PhoPQ-activated pathogenicity-related family protein [Marinilongibacter aquaticus]|uniref:PhoPQ-activated pathogenicity-related family protein n=1 Tax=Marinilongibacter aquaticus TaxID=2975157 RepID=UPI0021BD714E|nr:PhoPQ-activated pathogenicity-related family protein [Marinilongibacter aquaticus]UBM57182.1 PhoPQ-activated pathogenicity-related family protein [Marinilongibacter aquaticus]
MNWKLPCISLFVLCAIALACKNGKEETKTDEITPKTALKHYLDNGDETFEWLVEKSIPVGASQVHRLKLTSQTWRDIVWQHSLSVIVPENVESKDVLLFISGGNNKNSDLHPSDEDELTAELARIAEENHAITALIKQVPNQPLFDDLTEDALISYTLHNFKNDGDYSWPLLFPMVKSVVRGMDAIQDFCKTETQKEVDSFLLTGYSKRGWTTWLTGAQDERVKAIAPCVIDVLNMPVNVDYQVQSWGDYSVEIQDYVNLGIAQDMGSDSGKALSDMVDPYSYREMLDKPKLIFIGTNDPYWPVDAVKHYLYDLPGKTFIYYTPNAGHDLRRGVEAFPVLSEFFKDMINGFVYPDFTYNLKEEGNTYTCTISSKEPVERIESWTCQSEDRDFRDNEWTMTETAGSSDAHEYSFTVTAPESGFQSNYWNIVFKGENEESYPLSTRTCVVGNGKTYLQPGQ